MANTGVAVEGFPATHRHAPITFSEAVHVSHVGWRPDDPGKIGYLSCWTDTGGGLTYPNNMGFHCGVSAMAARLSAARRRWPRAPAIGEWPDFASYFDVPTWPMMTEYTISESLGPAALVWGYLAGRPAGR